MIGWVNTLRGQAKLGMHTPQEFVALDHLLHDMRLYKSRAELGRDAARGADRGRRAPARDAAPPGPACANTR